MNVWLDDERPMPAWFTHHAKTADEAIELLRTGEVKAISLDHDLGGDKTGYDVAKFIEEGAFSGTLSNMILSVHTANQAGRVNICRALQNAKRFWMQSARGAAG